MAGSERSAALAGVAQRLLLGDGQRDLVAQIRRLQMLRRHRAALGERDPRQDRDIRRLRQRRGVDCAQARLQARLQQAIAGGETGADAEARRLAGRLPVLRRADDFRIERDGPQRALGGAFEAIGCGVDLAHARIDRGEHDIARVRAEPGKYTYATSGTGAAAHLITLMFLSRAKLDAVHVPFQGSGPGLTAVTGGQVDFAIETLVATQALFLQGAVRALGVSLKDGTELAPELMPLARLPGVEGYDAGAFGGFMLPAGTPRPIIERLAAETEKSMATPEVKARLAQIGFQPQYRNTADFTAFLARHREEFRQVIQANNLRVDG